MVYTLKQKQDTDELHLFEATLNTEGTCTPQNESVCKKMKKAESVSNIFACQSESNARSLCIK